MIGAIRRAYANFRGFDLDGSTVPPMDGPLRPNSRLDEAKVALDLPEVDNLLAMGNQLVCSSGKDLLSLAPGKGTAAHKLAIAGRTSYDHLVSALADDGNGGLAIALDGRGVTLRGGAHDGAVIAGAAAAPFTCITAMAFSGPDTLYLCNGSATLAASAWKRDLMTKGASGSIWKVELSKPGMPASRLGDGLAFPSGIAVDGPRVVFSEAWRHRIQSIDLATGATTPVQSGLPAYPGRIARATAGGYWLAFFAPRNPLVEFVLKERQYCQRMVDTIEPDYWIAPSLATGRSFLEPIQGGARKKLNMLKPWAPTWSWGLVARTDPGLRFVDSYHSRADGHVHGVTSVCEHGGRLLVAAKGSGVIVAIDAAQEQQAP